MFDDQSVQGMEILLVEDGLVDARITIESLKQAQIHHRVTLVRLLREAREFLNRRSIFARAPKPDLLLLDLMLPDGDGLTLLSEVRASPELTDLPVVVLTSSHDEETRNRCRALGVDDFICKPVAVDQFLRVVREHKRLQIFSEPRRQLQSAAL